MSGAFTGGDAGANSSNVFATSQDFSYVQSLCAGKGVEVFNFGLGAVTLE